MLIFAETVFDMTHLIDAERLKTFVQARRDMHYNHYVKIGVGCIAECKYEEDVELLDLIESLQQEQLEGLHFTPVNRLIQKIPSKIWNDTVNNYAKIRDCLIKEGFLKDAKVLQDYISYMNGNNVPMATMDEQEQPEVDLEKEIIRYQREDMDRDTTVGDVARHFYKLGLNARKEE